MEIYIKLVENEKKMLEEVRQNNKKSNIYSHSQNVLELSIKIFNSLKELLSRNNNLPVKHSVFILH